MSSWWMVEGPDHRAAVMKRSAVINPELVSFLQVPASQVGYLDKLSVYKTWQMRYWELHGPYLMYWVSNVDHSNENYMHAPPQGAIDTRQIKASVLNSQLFLEPIGKGKTTRLRISTMNAVAAVGASVRASAQFDESANDVESTSINDWLRVISDAASYSDGAANPMVQKMEDHIRSSSTSLIQNRLSTSKKAASAQLLNNEKDSFLDQKDSLNNIELQNLDSECKNNEFGQESMYSEMMTADSIIVNENQDRIPRNLHIFLAIVGVQLYEPFHPDIDVNEDSSPPIKAHQTISRAYMLLIRCVIVLSCISALFDNFVNPYLSALLQGRHFFAPESSCASSPNAFEFTIPQFPCLLLVASYVSFVGGVASLGAYAWCIYYASDPTDLLRTHRLKLVPRVNRAVNVVSVQLCLLLSGVVIVFTVNEAVNIKNNRHDFDTAKKRNIAYATGFLNGFKFAVFLIPFFIVAAIVYAESRRLRYLVADFIGILKISPFNYRMIVAAHQEVVDEFAYIQNRYGLVMGLCSAFLGVVFVMCFIATYYVGVQAKVFHYRDDTTVIAYSQWCMFLAASASPLFVLLRALIFVNSAAEAIPEGCTDLVACLPLTEADGLQALRLANVVDKRPCQLLVLGYKAEPGDAVKLFAFIVAFQLASFTGMDWLVD